MSRLCLLVCLSALAACDGSNSDETPVAREKVTDASGEVFFSFAESGRRLIVRDEATTQPAANVIARATTRADGVGLFLFDQGARYLPRFAWVALDARDVWVIGATGSADVRARAVDRVPADVFGELLADSMRPVATASLAGLGAAVRDALAANSPFVDSGSVRLLERDGQDWLITTFECGHVESFGQWAAYYRASCHPESTLFAIWTPRNPFVADVVVVPDTLAGGPPAVPTISLGGVVRDARSGGPVANATVHLQPGDLRATTDASGGFAFETVPFGCTDPKSIVLIAARPGFQRATTTGQELALVAGNFAFATLGLRRAD
jgi:hypothetical protein